MSNREIVLLFAAVLIAVGLLTWTAISLMDRYLFAEGRPGFAAPVIISKSPA